MTAKPPIKRKTLLPRYVYRGVNHGYRVLIKLPHRGRRPGGKQVTVGTYPDLETAIRKRDLALELWDLN